MEDLRIDKWLWCVRLFKTRSIAAEACRAGKIKHEGIPVKPSHEVKIGNIYDISIDQIHKIIEVKELLSNRIGAKLISNYFIDLTPQEEYERIQTARQYGFEKRDRGAGRPTKRERRDIEGFKYK